MLSKSPDKRPAKPCPSETVTAGAHTQARGEVQNPEWQRLALGLPPTLQPKLRVGDPDDPQEHEADRVAEQVLRMADDHAHPPTAPLPPQPGSVIRRQVSGVDVDDEVETLRLQPLSPAPPAQPAPAPHVPTPDHEFARDLRALRSSGEPLPDSERRFFEPRFGADFGGVKIHRGPSAADLADRVQAQAFTVGHDIAFSAGAYQPNTTRGRTLLAHELTHVLQQHPAQPRGAPQGVFLQREPTKDPSFRFTITPTTTTDAMGFRILVYKQILGLDDATARELATQHKWSGPHSTGGVQQADVGKPIAVTIDAKIYRSFRPAVVPEGEVIDASGRGAGYADRSTKYTQLPAQDRATLDREIDRRFWDRTGYKKGQRLGDSKQDKEMAQLWHDIRDEVMVQREALRGLPVAVQDALGGAKSWKPSDYPQLTRIASKLSAAEWSDYLSRVVATTTDLDRLEASVTAYQQEKRKRDTDTATFKKIHLQLLGTEDLHKAYLAWQTQRLAAVGETIIIIGGSMRTIPPAASDVAAEQAARARLTQQMVAAGFKGGIPEYEKSMRDFVTAFETQAVHIGVTALEQYDSFLYKQQGKYNDDAVLTQLHLALAPMRASYAEFDKHKAIMDAASARYRRQQDLGRLPGSGHIRGDPADLALAESAQAEAQKHKDQAIASVQAISAAHPIFLEQHLPLNRRIDKAALARADKSGIKRILASHIAARRKDIAETKSNLKDDPEIIFKMDQLMAQAYQAMEIKQGSIHDTLVQQKARQIQRRAALIAVLVGVLAIAFTIMTFGTGAVAVVGVLGGLTVSGYAAYEEFEKYQMASAAAGSGMSSTEPSPVWLVVAVVGVAVEAAVAVKAVQALRPAAKAFEAGGAISDFNKAVQTLEKQGQIEAKIARSVERAAAAKEGYEAAKLGFSRALAGKMYSFPGPLADMDVYKAVVQIAFYRAKQGLESASQFILELNKMRTAAKLSELSGAELSLAKRAYAEGVEAAKVGTYETRIQWGIRSVEARPHGSVKGAFWGKRTPQKNPRVDAYERKINPSDESLYLPHPDGGFVQFEGIVGTVAQDGKLVMAERSIYHVADMPPFARNQVLAEAKRQLDGAKQAGLTVEWLVSDQKALTQLGDLFKSENLNIALKLLPE